MSSIKEFACTSPHPFSWMWKVIQVTLTTKPCRHPAWQCLPAWQHLQFQPNACWPRGCHTVMSTLQPSDKSCWLVTKQEVWEQTALWFKLCMKRYSSPQVLNLAIPYSLCPDSQCLSGQTGDGHSCRSGRQDLYEQQTETRRAWI